MRRTVSVIVCVLMAGFCTGVNAQIPEHTLFQPGSFGVPFQTFQMPPPMLVPVMPAMEHLAEGADGTDDLQTGWEKFSPQMTEPAPMFVPVPQPYQVPHLQFVYNHRTGRFHIAPYEPGYAASPWEFPVQTSPLHIWVSSKSSSAQPHPQVQYMCYHDPAPVILPAEIRLRGSGLFTPLTQAQPMPMPLPRPATAQPITPPARTRIGERVRQNSAPFIVR